MIGASMMAMLGCSIITDTELKYHILKNNKMLLNSCYGIISDKNKKVKKK